MLWDCESSCLKSEPEVHWVASLSSEAAGLQSEFLKPAGKPFGIRNSLLRQGKAQSALSLLRSLSPLQKCAALRFRFIPHTSSEGERKGETASYVPQAADSRSGIAALCSAQCYAGP